MENHRRSRSSSSSVENLESRRLLAAGDAALLAAGYQPITWHGQQAFAKPGQFILSLHNVHGKEQDQLKAINKLLGNVRKDAHAGRFLGADGLTLVQTPTTLTFDQASASLKKLPGFATLEPDFAVSA